MENGLKGIDPGFKQTIFEQECEMGNRYSDPKYVVPDNVQAHPRHDCNTKATATLLQTESELQESLSVAAHTEGNIKGVEKARFTAGAAFSQIAQELKSNKNAFVLTMANCAAYDVIIQSGNTPRLTQNFIKAVEKMVETAGRRGYTEFLDSFGTHFFKKVTMGGR